MKDKIAKIARFCSGEPEVLAGEVIGLLVKEIEGVENPYGITDTGLGFVTCQRKIINLLKSFCLFEITAAIIAPLTYSGI